MDPDFFKGGGSTSYEFAFNSSNFSDRVLRIEIMAEPAESAADGEGCRTTADWASRRKRRREDILKEKESAMNTSVCDLNCHPDAEDYVAYDSHGAEAVAKGDESPLGVCRDGDDDSQSSDSSWSMDYCQVVKVKSLHISSAILAAKSPFFYKLFSNGMRESDQRHATIRIYASEETALMELLSFMYSGKLLTTSAHLLLDVLMAADKFEVASCMRHCSQLLRSLPMTKDSAIMYLDLPLSVSMASVVQPLIDAAKDFLANMYKDLTKCEDEIMSLPLTVIEAILMSNDLKVASEDAVYDFAVKWAHAQYPTLEERRQVLGSLLIRLVRLPHMTCRKLRKVLTCDDLDPEIASKAVTEALFLKADTPYRQRALILDESTSRWLTERAYKYHPLKLVEFDRPHPQCIVYLDLKREDCAKLFPSGRAYSQPFHLGRLGFFLSAHCNMDQQSHCFGLFLGMQEKGSISFKVDYDFAARTRTSGEFVSKYKGYYTFTGGKAVGYRNLFAIPWRSFMAEDSLYFIDGVLHLRAELTIKQNTVS